MTIPRTLFDADHDLFRSTLRTFIAREIAPHYEQWESDGIVPREIWRRAGEVGLLCPTVPEKFGGAGGDFRDNVVVTEEMARGGFMAPAFYLQSDVVAPYLIDFGTDGQKERWLPRMVSGEVISAVGMSEPRGGSDLANLATAAVRDGDDFVINGQKVFITNGHLADLLVLAARTSPTGGKGVTLFLVETDSPGFQRGRRLQKIGCKAQDTAELFFSDLRVPAANVLGEVDRGFVLLMTQLAQERLMQAVRAVAVLRERRSSGRSRTPGRATNVRPHPGRLPEHPVRPWPSCTPTSSPSGSSSTVAWSSTSPVPWTQSTPPSWPR